MKKNFQEKINTLFRKEKIHNWLWIIILVGALFYFHWLLSELHIESNKLEERREGLKTELEKQREESQYLRAEFQIQFEEATDKLKNIFQGETPSTDSSSKYGE